MNLITIISLSIFGSLALIFFLLLVHNHFAELRVKRFFEKHASQEDKS